MKGHSFLSTAAIRGQQSSPQSERLGFVSGYWSTVISFSISASTPLAAPTGSSGADEMGWRSRRFFHYHISPPGRPRLERQYLYKRGQYEQHAAQRQGRQRRRLKTCTL